LSSHHLLLGQNGLFCLSSHQHLKKQQNNNFIDKLRFHVSKCFIARDSYWENIVHYPTANIIEVYKIITAELPQVSPIKGHTYAYIVNLSNNKATVLYCCFSEEIVSAAKAHKLWRLLPESLPYYRYLFNKQGLYFSSVALTPFHYLTKKENGLIQKDHGLTKKESVLIKERSSIEDNAQHTSELLLKIEADKLSSLPVNKNNLDMFTTAMLAESSTLEKNDIHQLFNKFNPLNVLDFGHHVIEKVTQLVKKQSHLTSYVAIVLLTSILTFMIGKSLFLSWHESHLTQLIAESKVTANKSLKLSNELKKIKNDIDNINTNLAGHPPRTQLLRILITLVNKDNQLKFSTIDISPSQMQIRGTITNAASLLSALSKVTGFNQVAFNTPPATLRKGGEGFNIQLHFNDNITHYTYQELTQ